NADPHPFPTRRSSDLQWKAQIESVDVGETRESTVRLVQKTGSEDSGLSDQQSGDRTGDTGTVQTGDTANIVPWSIAGAASLCISDRKSTRLNSSHVSI